MISATVASRTIWPWVAAVRALDHDPEPELQRLGLTEGQLRDPGQRIPYDRTQALVSGLIACVGRRDLGLLAAKAVEPGHFELLELAARSAETLGDAIQHLVRFFALVDAGGVLSFERTPTGAQMGYAACAGHPAHPAYLEYIPAMLLLAARRETQVESLSPQVARFRHGGPEDVGAWVELFGAPVEFGARETMAVVRPVDLELPMRRANARTHRSALAAICDWARKTGS